MPTEARATPITGLLELVGQPFSDHRGAFLNAFRGLQPAFAQVNLSRTEEVGVRRPGGE